MKKIVAILVIMLLAITACAQTEITSGQKVEGGSATTTKGEVAGDETTRMMEEVMASTQAKNDKTILLHIPVNSKIGSVGDKVVFGVMYNPINVATGGYFATITFVEARDKSSNKIEVDKATVKTWQRESVTNDFALVEKESKYIPAVFTIGSEIKPGVKTVPGAYQFEVQIVRRIDANFDEPIDAAVKSVYVRVE